MNNKQPSPFEQICTEIMLDAYELEAKLPEIIKSGKLSKPQTTEIAKWLDNLKGAGVDRISPYFKGVDWHPTEINERFQDFSTAVNQLLIILEEHMENSYVVRSYAEKLKRNTDRLIIEYEKRGFSHGLGERSPVPDMPDF